MKIVNLNNDITSIATSWENVSNKVSRNTSNTYGGYFTLYINDKIRIALISGNPNPKFSGADERIVATISTYIPKAYVFSSCTCRDDYGTVNITTGGDIKLTAASQNSPLYFFASYYY